MSKRIKSFFITLGSMLLAAFSTVIFTPQWGDFVAWLTQTGTDKAAALGIPAAVIIVLGLIIAEVWKAIINRYIIRQAGYTGRYSVSEARRELDLY